ncbi:MAG: ABC transporter substrate-binding protein [Candidatus Sulfotelmatobacter sp.]
MKHFGWKWLAASSLLIAALAANAEIRPQYGGVLRVAMRAAPASLDPAERNVADSFGRRNLTSLIFDTLVTMDDAERVRPVLAESWQALGNQQWRFRIRRNVKFHDGTPLTAESVAASLRFANPSWKVTADADWVMIQGEFSEEQLLAELTLPRNAVVKRDSGQLTGTGPFHIVEWQAGSALTLTADENCWRGRPFLDGIEVEMGKSYRDQMTALQLGRADLIEVSPEQTHRISQEGRRIASSMPIELVAVWFARDAASADEKLLRSALELSVERSSIRDVLLQGAGEPAGSVLPGWMSGYGFVFSTAADLAKARQLRAQVAAIPNWKLGYEADDPLAGLLTERLALNGRDAGLSLRTTPSSGADLRIARVPLEHDGWAALSDIAEQVGAPLTKKYGSLEELYAAERGLLASGKLIPLLHLPVSYASAPHLRSWKVRPDGMLNLEDAWLENTTP